MSYFKRVVLISVFFCLLLFLISCSWGKDNPGRSGKVREPVVAGQFYPEDPVELKEMIDKFISDVPDIEIDGDIFALISPHAGYEFSGPIAAYGYKAISGKSYDTVIVLAPSHQYSFDGASIYNEGPYATPLGEVPLDFDMIEDLMDSSEKIIYEPMAHKMEHSVEVQIPFLQVVLDDFKLVPIVIGGTSFETSLELSKAISESVGDKKVLIVASTDLSHYRSRSEAKSIDGIFEDLLKKNDPVILYDSLTMGRCEACGGMAVITALKAAKMLGYPNVTVLKYDDSGTTSGDTANVVGYISAVISGEGGVVLSEEEGGDLSITTEDKNKLLYIARKTIECGLTGKQLPDFDIQSDSLKEPCGAFVTLYKDGELRGCIGSTERDTPLYIVVERMAVGAAFHDPRFFTLREDELNDITIEVSVLSELEPVKKVKDIEVGTHGLVVEMGSYKGLLLPQVPVEQGWDRDEFLENVCLKAGLFSQSWKDDGAELYKFTAAVFAEQ